MIQCAPAARQFEKALVGGFPSGPAADIPPRKQAEHMKATDQVIPTKGLATGGVHI